MTHSCTRRNARLTAEVIKVLCDEGFIQPYLRGFSGRYPPMHLIERLKHFGRHCDLDHIDRSSSGRPRQRIRHARPIWRPFNMSAPEMLFISVTPPPDVQVPETLAAIAGDMQQAEKWQRDRRLPAAIVDLTHPHSRVPCLSVRSMLPVPGKRSSTTSPST